MDYNDDMIRVHAEDYASLVTQLVATRRQLRECENAAAESTGQWHVELDHLLGQFNGCRPGFCGPVAGGAAPPGGCNGTIDFSNGCPQPMLGS